MENTMAARASDFAISKPIIIDANFEGIRRMRVAFPNKTYSVFIRTGMGEDRRRQLLTARGVHTEEEIESRVRLELVCYPHSKT